MDEQSNKDELLDLRGRTITITVGSLTPKTFTAHESVICGTSEFFRTAMKPHWETSTRGTITLKEEDPAVFETYLHWLYRRTFPVRDGTRGDWNAEWVELAQAFVLGEMLQDDTFKDAVLQATCRKSRFIQSNHGFPNGPAICCIYEGTPETSAARRLLVDICSCHAKGAWLTKQSEQDGLPTQFILDLAVAALDKRAPCGAGHFKGTCQYHPSKPRGVY